MQVLAMFKKCKNTVCSTNSIAINSSTKVPVTVVRHRELEASVEGCAAKETEGTNCMLKNGAMLPFVLPQQTQQVSTALMTENRPLKKKLHSVQRSNGSKSESTVLCPRTIPEAHRNFQEKRSHTILQVCENSQERRKHSGPRLQTLATQPDHSERLAEHLEETCKLGEEESHVTINKENYLRFISQFNEYDYKDTYNPLEYCGNQEQKQEKPKTLPKKTLPPTSTSRCQASEDTTSVRYDEKTKVEILQSIREELQSWRRSEQ